MKDHRQQNQRGQTSVEYLMLLSFAAMTALLVLGGPVANFINGLVDNIRGGLQNTVRNGEWRTGQAVETGQSGHPGNPERLQPLHL